MLKSISKSRLKTLSDINVCELSNEQKPFKVFEKQAPVQVNSGWKHAPCSKDGGSPASAQTEAATSLLSDSKGRHDLILK